MKTHMITLDESEEIITKFFTFNLDVERVVTAYRQVRERQMIVNHLRNKIKELLFIIEADLLGLQKIKQMKFFDNWNPQINSKILNLHEILSTKRAKEFIYYFTYKSSFSVKNRFERKNIPPLDSSTKLQIYLEFYNYFNNRNLFNVKDPVNEPKTLEKDAKVYSIIKYSYSGPRTERLRQLVERQKSEVYNEIREEMKKVLMERKFI